MNTIIDVLEKITKRIKKRETEIKAKHTQGKIERRK